MNLLLIGLVVLIHYEFLRILTSLNPTIIIKPRLKVLLGVIGALLTHIVEVWVFALAFYGLINFSNCGTLTGAVESPISLLDCLYFSFSSYTSLGYGDIIPTEYLRFTAVLETLTGLVLITWTASFMYIEMQNFWEKKYGRRSSDDIIS